VKLGNVILLWRLWRAVRPKKAPAQVEYPNNPPVRAPGRVKEVAMSGVPTPVVEVPVKSPLKSKINITAAIAAVVALANAFGYVVPDSWVSTATTAVSILSPILIIFFKTWFTKSVTAQSAKGM